AAYVFSKLSGAFTQMTALIAADTITTDKFANRIAIADDIMVVSGHANDDGGTDS
ncbi:unnamed protein product, partial [Symbiodinium microadriaticum]